MNFDDEVDQLKRELQTSKLDAGERRAATKKLCTKLQDTIRSRRLEFAVDEEQDEPFIAIGHTGTKERLASVFVNEDGSITFQSTLSDEDAMDEDEDDDLGYFPTYVEYYDEEEFLEEIPEVLKLGVAEYEIDQNEESDS